MQENQNFSLRKLNTLGVEIQAARYVVIEQPPELEKFFATNDLHSYQYTGKKDSRCLFLLGSGSNTLFVGDFPGTVMKLDLKGMKVVKEDDWEVHLEVNAGESWSDLVDYTVENGWSGMENLALIPGTVGAAPIQNIGAYGGEFSDTCIKIRVFDTHDHVWRDFLAPECDFGYRTSMFKQDEYRGRFLVTRLWFKLLKNVRISPEYLDHGRRESLQEELEKIAQKPFTPKDVAQAVKNIRTRKLPDLTQEFTAGSFFQNPIITQKQLAKLHQRMNVPEERRQVPSWPARGIKNRGLFKVPAGWLLEDIGWRGREEGNCCTSDKQALVVQTNGRASGLEVHAFIQKIQQDFQQSYGFPLLPEVVII